MSCTSAPRAPSCAAKLAGSAIPAAASTRLLRRIPAGWLVPDCNPSSRSQASWATLTASPGRRADKRAASAPAASLPARLRVTTTQSARRSAPHPSRHGPASRKNARSTLRGASSPSRRPRGCRSPPRAGASARWEADRARTPPRAAASLRRTRAPAGSAAPARSSPRHRPPTPSARREQHSPVPRPPSLFPTVSHVVQRPLDLRDSPPQSVLAISDLEWRAVRHVDGGERSRDAEPGPPLNPPRGPPAPPHRDDEGPGVLRRNQRAGLHSPRRSLGPVRRGSNLSALLQVADQAEQPYCPAPPARAPYHPVAPPPAQLGEVAAVPVPADEQP